MNSRKFSVIGFLLLFTIVFVAGCGKSSSDTAAPVYKVQYLPGTGMNAPVQGKTAFQIKITKQSDGSPATGLNPSLTLMMHMTNGDSHATPVDSVKESSTPGTYDCTVYYMMASGPTMGTWDMNITVGGETTTVNPDVAMAMDNDTIRTILYGADDVVTGMSGTVYNKFFIFRDGMISAATPTLKLYITHAENMMMDFLPVSEGSVLSSGTVTAMIVTASTDSTFPATPGVTVTGTDDSNGHWELSGLSSLSSAGTYTVYVELKVNGQDKTTDGKAGSGENAYATFFVTSGM
jgi:hypothetical protein